MVYLHIQGTKTALNWRKPAARKQHFFKTNLFKEWLKKFVALVTKEKGKMTVNKWENDDSDILWALYSVYKKRYLLVNLFKQRYISFVKVINVWKSSSVKYKRNGLKL